MGDDKLIAPLSFLVGDWQASGEGSPGSSVGQFSFTWAADGHAMIRHNEAFTPEGRHSDIMLIYGLPDHTVHAIFTDNEGHTIEYLAAIQTDQQRVEFESTSAGPRFRLWYQLNADGSLATGFQIAPPGSTDFQTYLEGVAHRTYNLSEI